MSIIDLLHVVKICHEIYSLLITQYLTISNVLFCETELQTRNKKHIYIMVTIPLT